MASGIIFDPYVLLRLAPALTSTATLIFGHDHDLLMQPFLDESARDKSNAVLPHWIKPYMARAVYFVFTVYPLTASLAIANALTRNPSNETATTWYWAGLAFTLGHFAFAKRALDAMNAISADESKGNSTKDLKKWLDNNLLRSLSVDLPGWASFVVAALLSLKV